VSNHPRRDYGTKDLHFITCSCYHRQCWLASPQRRDLFLAVFEEVRQRYRFVVSGYVVMPDHIHLLIIEKEKGDPSRVMQALEQGFSRRVLKSVRRRRVAAQQELFAVGSEHVWQRRFYDFNVWTAHKRIGETALHAPQSRKPGVGARTGAVAVEQLSQFCFRGRGRGANQSVGRGQDENPRPGCMSPHLYKKRKGGPSTNITVNGQ
jgi:REP element-mobilizing transposase RayT